MTTLATLVVKLVGDTKDLQRSMNETNGIVEQSTGRMGAFGGVLRGGLIAGVGVAVGGLAALGAGLYSAVGEAMAAEEVSAQLNATLASTGGAAGMTAEAINAHALALSSMTRFEDDAIVASSALLLTFTKIGQDVFPAAQASILDLSQAMSMDLQSATTMVGKALNDPIAGLTAMGKAGIQFTDAQKETIKAMVELGDVAGAQKLILGELKTQFGGSAVAAGQTLAGQLDILKNQFGNIKEEVGGALLPALTTLGQTLGPMLITAAQGLANFLITSVIPALVQLFQWVATNLPPALQKLALFWTGTLQPALAQVWAFIQGSVIPVLQQVFAWLATNLPPALQKLAQFWTGTLQPALAAVWSFLQGSVIPILQQVFAWLATNIPPAIQALAQFWTGTLQPALAAVWAFIQGSVIPILQEIFTWLATNLPPALQTLADFWNNTLLPAINAVWSFIQTNLVPIFQALVNLYIASLKLALTVLAWTWENVIMPALRLVWQYLQDHILTALVGLKAILDGPVATALQTFKNMMEGPVATAIGIVEGIMLALKGAIDGVVGAINTVIGWLQSLIDKISSLPALPSYLTHNSPSPFEQALRGISDALPETSQRIGQFAGELGRLGSTALGSASGLALIRDALFGLGSAFQGGGAGAGGGDIFDLLRQFLERLQAVAEKMDLEGLEPALALAEAASKIGAAMRAAIEGIQLAMAFELPPVDNIDALFNALRFFVARLQTTAYLMGWKVFDDAVALAEAAAKIGGAMKAAIEGIQLAVSFRVDRIADGTDLLFEALRFFVARLQTVATEMDQTGLAAAQSLAEAAGAIGSNVADAIEGILLAMAFRVDRMADGTELFISQLEQFVRTLASAGVLFDEAGLKAATALAEAAGKIGTNVEDAILGMTAVAKYAGLELTAGARLFADDAAVLVRELISVALQFETAALSAAKDFADAAGSIGSQIESAIAGMRAIMDYAGGLAATAVTRLATDLATMVDGLVLASGAFDGDGLAAAQALAEAAGAIGSSISATVEGLQAIMAYAGGLTQEAIDRLVVDLQLMVQGLQAAAFAFSADGLASAERLATAAGVIGDGVASLADAMQEIVNYVAPSPERIDEFAADMYTVVEKFRIVAAVLGEEGIAQAERFALAGAAIYQAIEDGIDSVLGISNSGAMGGVGNAMDEMVAQVLGGMEGMAEAFTEMVGDAYDFGSGWVDAIMDGLNSRLGDLEELMAYIRGLFPSSPAEHGAWSDLPDGEAVGERFTSAMASAVAAGSSSVAEALAGLRSAFGMDPQAAAAGGQFAGGGISITVNVQGGEPGQVREAANLGVMEAARALGWA